MKKARESDFANSEQDGIGLNEKILEIFVEEIAVLIEKGDIPIDAWEKALNELAERKNHEDISP